MGGSLKVHAKPAYADSAEITARAVPRKLVCKRAPAPKGDLKECIIAEQSKN